MIERQKPPFCGPFAKQGPVEGLILGSSRSLMIAPRKVGDQTGLRYFNFAASGTTTADWASIYAGVRRQGLHPRHVILGLDMDALLSRKRTDERKKALAAGSVVAKTTKLLGDFKSLFNVDYAGDTVRSFALAAGFLTPHRNGFDADGRFHWDKPGPSLIRKPRAASF